MCSKQRKVSHILYSEFRALLEAGRVGELSVGLPDGRWRSNVFEIAIGPCEAQAPSTLRTQLRVSDEPRNRPMAARKRAMPLPSNGYLLINYSPKTTARYL